MGMTRATGKRPRYGSDLATKLAFYTRINYKTGCHEWIGGVHNNQAKASYGCLNWKGKPTKVHRLSYELANGPIPAGLHVLHNCDNPLCLNPEHLRAGTPQDNVDDREERGRGGQDKRRGMAHGRAKLTDQQVIAIRADPRPNHATVAADYDVSRVLIRLIRARKLWTHI